MLQSYQNAKEQRSQHLRNEYNCSNMASSGLINDNLRLRERLNHGDHIFTSKNGEKSKNKKAIEHAQQSKKIKEGKISNIAQKIKVQMN